MYKIVRKKELNASVTLMEIEAPFIAKKAKAGQFIIFRIDEMGERVPLTIAGYDREAGTVTIIFQKVGFSTIALGNLNEGDYIRDFVGPLASPPTPKVSSGSVWSAAVSAAPSLCPPLLLSRKQVLRSMSLSASATRTSSFWRTSSRLSPTICT